jgi:hypothetical protein
LPDAKPIHVAEYGYRYYDPLTDRWNVRGMRDVPIHTIGETQKAKVANDTFCIHFFPLAATIEYIK